MELSYWICVAVTLISAITSFGFSLIALKTAKNEALVNALYASSRSIALVVAGIVPIFYHSVTWLLVISLIMIIVQAVDALIGIKIKDKVKTYGPALTAVFNLTVLIWLINS